MSENTGRSYKAWVRPHQKSYWSVLADKMRGKGKEPKHVPVYLPADGKPRDRSSRRAPSHDSEEERDFRNFGNDDSSPQHSHRSHREHESSHSSYRTSYRGGESSRSRDSRFAPGHGGEFQGGGSYRPDPIGRAPPTEYHPSNAKGAGRKLNPDEMRGHVEEGGQTYRGERARGEEGPSHYMSDRSSWRGK